MATPVFAFPIDPNVDLNDDRKWCGMTLRDFFLFMAMQGALSGCAARGEIIMYSDLAALSYEMADAMMKAREA
jgi:hypothetical protein